MRAVVLVLRGEFFWFWLFIVTQENVILVYVFDKSRATAFLSFSIHMIYNKKLLSFEQAVKPELQLDCDSYLFTSKIIDFVIVIMVCCLLFAPLSFVYFFMNLFCCFPENRGKSNWEILRINLSLVLLLLFSIVLILPGTLVVATVASCLISLREEYYDVSSELDGGIITVMHVLFIVFYFFLSMKEVSSSVKTMAYFFKVIGENWKEQSLEEKNGAMKTKDNPKSWACLNFLRKSIIAFLSSSLFHSWMTKLATSNKHLL